MMLSHEALAQPARVYTLHTLHDFIWLPMSDDISAPPSLDSRSAASETNTAYIRVSNPKDSTSTVGRMKVSDPRNRSMIIRWSGWIFQIWTKTDLSPPMGNSQLLVFGSVWNEDVSLKPCDVFEQEGPLWDLSSVDKARNIWVSWFPNTFELRSESKKKFWG